MKSIAVIDGQGGGVGKAIVARLRQAFGKDVHIIALGTNSLATSPMLKAGADVAATGENAIVVTVAKVDIVMGAIGILAADAMMGEVTPAMARAIGQSEAQKILLPLNRCGLTVAGVKAIPFTECIAEAVELVRQAL